MQPRLRSAPLLAAALLGIVAAPTASAQAPVARTGDVLASSAVEQRRAVVPAVELEEDRGYTGKLAVDAHGGAVVAWRDYTVRGGDSIVVSVRRPGSAFVAQRRVSSREPSEFALAAGPRGDAAVVVRQAGPRPSSQELVLARARPGGRFATPRQLPASSSASEPAAAIDARGTLLVAWLQRSGRLGCGHVVMASVTPASGPFGAARRVSPACPNAALASVALARNGAGAVVWRSGRDVRTEQPRFAVQVSAYAGGRFAPPRTVSSGRVWFGRPALVAGGTRALVAWRDHVRSTRSYETRGRVLAVAIGGARIGRPVAVSTADRIQGDVYAAMNRGDAAIVSWVQTSRGDAGSRVAMRPGPGAPFTAPETIAACARGQTLDGSGREHLDSAARVALDGAGRALAIFGENCGGGLGAARRASGDPWQPPFAVGTAEPGEQARPMSVGVSDAGEGVALFSNPQLHPESFDGALLRAAVIPAPAGG